MSALQELTDLKKHYSDPYSRTPGWDQQARSKAIEILVKHYHHDLRATTTDAFLTVLLKLTGA